MIQNYSSVGSTSNVSTTSSVADANGSAVALANSYANAALGNVAKDQTVDLNSSGSGNDSNGTSGAEIRNYSSTLKNNPNMVMSSSTNEADRWKSLAQFSQESGIKSDDAAVDHDTCGPTALTAGMYAANGKQGLVDLMDSMKDYNKSEHLGQDKDLKNLQGIEDKMKQGGNVTAGDMSKIDRALYWEMQARQGGLNSDDPANNPDGSGTNVRTINDFLSKESKVKSTLDNDRLGVALVSTNNSANGNHYVLGKGTADKTDAVYDPEAIQGASGGLDQVTTDQSVIGKYVGADRS